MLGNEEQRQRSLPHHGARSEEPGRSPLTEPAHGSDSVSLETSARRDGDRSGAQRAQALDRRRQHHETSSCSTPGTGGRAGQCFVVEKQEDGQYPRLRRGHCRQDRQARHQPGGHHDRGPADRGANRLENCHSLGGRRQGPQGHARRCVLGGHRHGMAAFEIAANCAWSASSSACRSPTTSWCRSAWPPCSRT
ncbi:hypothetical protein QJS66_19180 [Kocuria rhizophila]|nr:hypothetical protein QJS66_19180 [Kocuria rhizophila]